jgi:predicted RNA-binding Zn-ribbon protein involved in translation (DUF1610 family)
MEYMMNSTSEKVVCMNCGWIGTYETMYFHDVLAETGACPECGHDDFGDPEEE